MKTRSLEEQNKNITVRIGIKNRLVFGRTVSSLVSQWVVAYLYITFFDLLVCFVLSFSLLFNFLYLLSLSHFYSFISLFFSYAGLSLHTRSLYMCINLEAGVRLSNERFGMHTHGNGVRCLMKSHRYADIMKTG